MSTKTNLEATTAVVADARPDTVHTAGMNLPAVRAYRSPSPTFADIVGTTFDAQDPHSVSGKQLRTHPPV